MVSEILDKKQIKVFKLKTVASRLVKLGITSLKLLRSEWAEVLENIFLANVNQMGSTPTLVIFYTLCQYR